VFNGIFDLSIVLNAPKINILYQKFAGVIIQLSKPVFNPDKAIFMDFSLSQDKCTMFGCFLPISSKEAFVEVVSMTKQANNNHIKDTLDNYLNHILKLPVYKISYKESGFIPMTNYSFPAGKNSIVNIGTAGGQVKASTGYAFINQQKHAEAIVQTIISKGNPVIEIPFIKRRHNLYDSTLLNVLKDKPGHGKRFFIRLFKHNSTSLLFKFLDERTNILQELKIFTTVNIPLFIKWITISLTQWVSKKI
jgi:lycopene beta-cyclase